jgi:hypothetical protein
MNNSPYPFLMSIGETGRSGGLFFTSIGGGQSRSSQIVTGPSL